MCIGNWSTLILVSSNWDLNGLIHSTYDANGNTTASTGLGYAYDFENRLIQQGGISYIYDGDGNRRTKTVNGVTTQYVVDAQNPTGYAQVLQEIPSNTFPSTYVYGLEQISRKRNYSNSQGFTVTETIYYVHDGHGSVRALTDPTGTVTDTYDYDAFGNLIHSSFTGATATPNNYLFAGEQLDPDLNLYYNRARYLNTSTGRFWSMDTDDGTAYEPNSLHKYLYAGANPVGNSDPSGNDFEDVTFAAGEEATIGAEEDAAALRIYQTAFRTTLYAGNGILYETPTLLLRAAAALTALTVAASSVISAFEQTPGELPDVAASQTNETPMVLFRDTSGTSPSDFKWRGPDAEPDGLSFFEQRFKNPQPKPFSIGFKATFVGAHQQGALGGFTEPELYGIGVIYTPQLAGGQDHWSCPVAQDTAQSYADRFAAAAKRIKKEKQNFFPNPNP